MNTLMPELYLFRKLKQPIHEIQKALECHYFHWFRKVSSSLPLAALVQRWFTSAFADGLMDDKTA